MALQPDGLQVDEGNKTTLIPYLQIGRVYRSVGLIWDELRVTTEQRIYRLVHLTSADSQQFIELLQYLIRQEIKRSLLELNANRSDQVQQQLQSLVEGDSYLSRFLLQEVLQKLAENEGLAGILSHPFFCELSAGDFSAKEKELWQQISILQGLLVADSEWIRQHNDKFIDQEIERYSELFSQVESYPLTPEQMRAVVTEEDRNLLIASAGSGKSSTLVAKVAYLLKKGLAKPNEICVLAYNEEAASSIRQRIAQMQLKLNLYSDGESLSAKVYSATFHALGLAIIRKQQGSAPNLSPMAGAGRLQMLNYFQQKIEVLLQDEDFSHAWYDYLAIAKKPRPNLFAFATQKAYYDYLAQMGASYAQTKEGKKRPLFTALNGIKVSSMEALSLANWLVAQGVQFLYLHPISGSDNRNAIADFYFPEADLYHFHFALNEQKQWPSFLSDYANFIDKRRKAAKRFKVDVFETYSYQFDQGSIFSDLKEILETAGVSFSPLSNQNLAQLVNRFYKPEEDLAIFEAFLRHFKANGGDISAFDKKLSVQEVQDPIRTTLFLEVFAQLYQAYQDELDAYGQIDFNDQINLACDYLETHQFKHPFKYLLVDEFQDISQDRKRLLQALLEQEPQCKLLAVGDDWQSIYRFSGADIDIMTHFTRHFGPSSLNYLTQTFRCYQGIADVAAEFVQENPDQLRKQVFAHADIQVDQVHIEAYESESEQLELVQNTLWKLQQMAHKRGLSLKVFLLARYHRQKPDNLANYQVRYPSLQIEFKSIHASKGLEADYVILMGLESGAYGFPSELSDDALLHLVIPQPESFPHAEERRLLYVALTRAKRGVFILCSAADQSEFVHQLGKIERVRISEKLVEVELCPKCHSGKLQERRGQYSIFLGCSHYPACDYTEKKVCPKCEEGTMLARESEHGRFYGCSTYPECDYIDQ